MFFLTDITISMIGIPLFWGTYIPDRDSGLDKGLHRWILLHSIAIPLFFFIFEQSTLVALLIFTQGLHCLCDIHLRRKKQVGTYTIKYVRIRSKRSKKRKIIGMNGLNSTIFLIANFAIGLTILTVWVWVF